MHSPILFVGSYTTDTQREGIYTLEFDTEHREITMLSANDESINPSYVRPYGSLLFASNERENCGEITSFAIAEDNTLKLVDSYTDDGKETCYVAIHPSGRYIYAANYASGSIIGCELLPDGHFGKGLQLVQHEGGSLHPDRQTSAHVHTLSFLPDSQSLMIAVDLGNDTLSRYDTSEDGECKPTDRGVLDVPAGEGPRMVSYHPRLPLVAVITELNNNVFMFEIDAETGAWNHAATHSLLPEDYESDSLAAHIEFSPDGRYLYASTRGPDQIVVFAQQPDNTFKYQVAFPSGGNHPRHFSLSPYGSYLAVANQYSDDVVIYSRNANSGNLDEEAARIKIPQPSCVMWKE